MNEEIIFFFVYRDLDSMFTPHITPFDGITSFVYPPGKPMIPHLLRCQGFAVVYYDFALGRLESGASSTFAQLGF
jgi:hypothetical protein